jgi:AcrR family transcriptional regulator/DNA-binding MarR family transcriptional regulator
MVSSRARVPVGSSGGGVRERLLDLQRARIVAAMLDAAAKRGGGSVTVADVVKRSGVSRRTFYDVFVDAEDCLLAAFEQALDYAAERVVPAYEAQSGWRESIRAGLVALLGLLDENPIVGRVLIVESLSGGPRVAARREDVIRLLTSVIERGRAGAIGGGAVVAPLVGEGIVGGVLSVIRTRMSGGGTRVGGGDDASLVCLTSALMSMIVLPYLGRAAARRELERAAPSVSVTEHSDAPTVDPFKEAGLRLTYRTVRVLVAIGAHPGASNRTIGEASEIKDQGQISKLLARLERGGMVANEASDASKGAPNSWTLSEAGARIVATVQALTESAPGRRSQTRLRAEDGLKPNKEREEQR